MSPVNSRCCFPVFGEIGVILSSQKVAFAIKDENKKLYADSLYA